jgi:hypothetical protein
MSEYRYLIIGGTMKAGTTSLFIYLADHPEICASKTKETRFFLDADYPLDVKSKFRFEDGLDKYDIYFNHCKRERLRLEASPQYLCSPGTPSKIKKSLPDVKIVFILREPIDRLISEYRFLKQLNELPLEVSFEEYVQSQLHGRPAELHRIRALEEGRYSIYLKPYFDLFGRDRLCILKYEDLKQNANTLLTKVCRFTGIDPTFYQDYSFQIFNKTQMMKSVRLHNVYRQIILGLRARVYDKPRVRAILRPIRRRLEPFYLRLNRRPDEHVFISESLRALLEDYYSDEPAALASLLGQKKFSWESSQSSVHEDNNA